MKTAIKSTDNASGKGSDNENFPVGSILIRADLRPHVHAFYNFAREADDISDHPTMDGQKKILKLEAFSRTLTDDRCEEVKSAVALRRSLRQTGVSPQHALDLITAFKRDSLQLRYRDWEDLMDYCNFSANPVGRYMLDLHKVEKTSWPSNDVLCSALQILNHIQDCAEDCRELDRVYLPQDMMEKFDVTTDDLIRETSSQGLRALIDAMLDKLEPMIEEARKLPKQIPARRLRLETSAICVLAEQMIKTLRSRDPLCENTKPSKTMKIFAVLKGVARAFL